MASSQDFTPAELDTIREMLSQRYRKDVQIHLADSDINLHADARAPVTCPTVFWHARDANFVVIKVARFDYRTQFFYTPHEQYATGIERYQNLEECVAAVLQTQADHERARQGVSGAGDASLKS